MGNVTVTVGFLYIWLFLLSVAFLVHWYKVDRALPGQGEPAGRMAQAFRRILMK